MPIADVQLADGRVVMLEVPEGTTEEQVIQFVKNNQGQFGGPEPESAGTTEAASTDGATQDQSTPAQDDIFAGLPNDVIEDIKSKSVSGRQKSYDARRAKEFADIERLRLDNPDLVEMIEGMNPAEAFMVGAGKGVTDLGRGVARIFGAEPVDEDQKRIDNALTQVSGAANVGQFAGQSAPFAMLGPAVGGISSLAGRSAAMGALGASEGGLITAGKGGDAGEIATSAAIGGALGSIGEVGATGANRLLRKFIDKVGKRVPADAKLLTPEGTPTPELQKVLDETGSTFDDALKQGAQSATTLTKAGKSKIKTSARMRQVAKNTEIDEDTIGAMQRLGLNPDDAPVGFIARDQGTKDVSGALSVVPGSESNAQYNSFMQKIAGDADQGIKGVGTETIEKLKGRIDTGTYSNEIMDEIDSGIQVIKKAENTAYDKARQVLDDSTLINVKPARNVLESTKRRLKATKLEGADSAVYKVVSQPKVTYADIDNLRKQIGSGMSRQGRFKDADQAKLSLWYGRLSDLQEGAASQINKEAGQLIGNAKKLSRDRFALQESSNALFGKDGLADVFPKLEGELKRAAGKGGLKKFKSIMEQVPKEHRQGVVASALKGVFTPSQGKSTTFTPTSFNHWMTAMKRDPKAYAEITSYLPPQGRARLEDMHKLSRAISDVQSKRVPTGVTPDEFRSLDQNGIIKRLISGVARRGADIATGGTTGGAAGEVVTQMATSGRAMNVADSVLASPEFRSTIRAAVSGGTKSSAYTRNLAKLKKTKAYKRYMDDLDGSASSAIISAGLVPYVLGANKTGDE